MGCNSHCKSIVGTYNYSKHKLTWNWNYHISYRQLSLSHSDYSPSVFLSRSDYHNPVWSVSWYWPTVGRRPTAVCIVGNVGLEVGE